MDSGERCNSRRKPDWLKITLGGEKEYSHISDIVSSNGLHTICSSGKCPNMGECWSRGTATFMILGDICTRSCKFCATNTGKPLAIDVNEPSKIANSVKLMRLRHCVITSVDRDDLSDGGVSQWSRVIEKVRKENPKTTIEVLIPDFDAKEELIDIVIEARPDIIGHNIETVRRITPQVRSKAEYDQSLKVLEYLSEHGVVAKSGLMVGIGETNEEVYETLEDLKRAGCRIVTLGQYLQPTKKHIAVERYVEPSVFKEYEKKAYQMGFDYVASGPLVRSSYMADKAMENSRIVLSSPVKG